MESKNKIIGLQIDRPLLEVVDSNASKGRLTRSAYIRNLIAKQLLNNEVANVA